MSTHPQEPTWQDAGSPAHPQPGDPWTVPAYGAPEYHQAGQPYWQAAPASYGTPYGHPYAAPPGYGYPAPQPGGPTPGVGMGIAGFVTGLLGLLLCWIPGLGVLLAIVGIVLSAVGMSQIRRSHGNAGLAIAGLACGCIGALLFFVLLLSVAADSSF